MRRFVLWWKKLGCEERWRAYIVNYADELVICCRGGAEQALATMRETMSKLKLTVNETKTRACYLPEERFDFLGYTFGRCYSMKKDRVFLCTVPSKKRVQRICRAISDESRRIDLAFERFAFFCRRTILAASRAADSVWWNAGLGNYFSQPGYRRTRLSA
jgi:hypothetical protein